MRWFARRIGWWLMGFPVIKVATYNEQTTQMRKSGWRLRRYRLGAEIHDWGGR